VNTISKEVVDGRRRRRTHSAEFKAHVVAACMQPGVSIAAVAMANGVNANLARRWVHQDEFAHDRQGLGRPTSVTPAASIESASFVPLQLPQPAAPVAATDIRIELRRGATSISVHWPAHAAGECATWMRELLR